MLLRRQNKKRYAATAVDYADIQHKLHATDQHKAVHSADSIPNATAASAFCIADRTQMLQATLQNHIPFPEYTEHGRERSVAH